MRALHRRERRFWSQTFQIALDAGHWVQAMVRNTDRIEITHALLERHSADAIYPEAVRAALKCVKAIIQGIGVAPRRIVKTSG